MMWSSDSDRDEAASPTTAASSSSCSSSSPFDPPPHPRRRRHRARRRAMRGAKTSASGAEEAEDVWRGLQQQQQRAAEAWPRRASRPVVVAAAGGDDGVAPPLDRMGSAGSGGGMGRARSLTDDDLEELKGCVDLGFGFSYDEIPELCGTLPALELCYSMSQRFLDEHDKHLGKAAEEAAAAPPPQAATTAPASPAQPAATTNWKISSPGDSPDEVKARLKYWAQAVACTVKLCS